MSADKIAAALGNEKREGRRWRCICPIHGGQSLVLADGRDGRLLVKCWGGGCDPRDILAELRCRRLIGDDHRGDMSSADDRSDDRCDRERRIEIARRVWGAARDARGTPVQRYLVDRGITMLVPPSLRYAPALRRPNGAYGPAMVARVDSLEGELIAVHRTWLARDDRGQWRRRDRASLGPIGSGAVRLSPAAETLMIGEGLENCLSAIQACALPAWAALSTSGMTGLVLPPTVRCIILLADNDANGAGERAARAAAGRWIAEGRRVRLALPPEPGTDLNDVLLGRGHTQFEGVCHVAA